MEALVRHYAQYGILRKQVFHAVNFTGLFINCTGLFVLFECEKCMVYICVSWYSSCLIVSSQKILFQVEFLLKNFIIVFTIMIIIMILIRSLIQVMLNGFSGLINFGNITFLGVYDTHSSILYLIRFKAFSFLYKGFVKKQISVNIVKVFILFHGNFRRIVKSFF